MIIKPRTTPLKIPTLERTMVRLDETHPYQPIAKGELKRWRAGYRGEKNIDYYLNDLEFTHPGTLVIQDLRLKHNGQTFQIDNLILTKNLFYPIEGKELAGKVILDPYAQQMTRTIGEESETYIEPTNQLNRMIKKLNNWITNHSKITIPIQGTVVFTNEKMHLETTATNQWLQTNFCRAPGLFTKFEQTLNNFTKPQMTDRQLNEVAKKLVNAHQPRLPSYNTDRHFKKTDLKTGVICPSCTTSIMKWKKFSWHCNKCQHKSRTAHNQAVVDYALLISDKITNNELRQYLHLESRHTAYRIIKKLELPLLEKKGYPKYYDLKKLIYDLN